jgi:hypothetical protein
MAMCYLVPTCSTINLATQKRTSQSFWNISRLVHPGIRGRAKKDVDARETKFPAKSHYADMAGVWARA